MDTRSPIPSRALPPPPSEPTLSVRDVYYILFRHKWKIVLCSLGGIIAGAGFYFTHSPPYQSETKLYIAYVVSENAFPVGIGPVETRKSPDMRGETIMDTEIELLTSFDLAKLVADAVGPERILAKAGGGKDLNNAADLVRHGLKAQVTPRSAVIAISFTHPDAEVIQPVLENLVDKYLKQHKEMHSKGMLNDFLGQETDGLKAKLMLAEEALQKTRNKAGFISLEDAKNSVSRSINLLKEERGKALTQLAEKQAAYAVLAKRRASSLPPAPAPTSDATPATTSPAPADAAVASEATLASDAAPAPAPAAATTTVKAEATSANPEPARATTEAARSAGPEMPPAEAFEEFREIQAKVSQLQSKELSLLLTFTKDNKQVKDVGAQLDEAKQAKRALEEKYPFFTQAMQPAATAAAPGAPAAPAAPVVDLGVIEAEIAALQAKAKELDRQFDLVKKEQANIDENELTFMNAQRERDLIAEQYDASRKSLDQGRMRENLNPTKVQNIKQIQAPPPPFMDRSKTKKTAGMAIAGGIAAGLAWAFLIEMLLDRSVRRPVEFERSLGLQLFLSIPEDKRLRRSQRGKTKKKRLSLKAGGNDQPAPTGESELLAPIDEAEGLRPFHETLRDRLIGYFERRNLTHKPKLIAVTGIGSGSGVTTTTAGLARALSETGDGNVLVVDMTPGQGTALQFSRGKEIQGLESLLETRQNTSPVQDNLYLVTEATNGDKLSRILPQRFSKLLPKLKSSDFDYIIFDMPAVSQISITPRLAEFMDMVLLVVESEKTDRETVQRAAALLAETKAHVGALLNKTRNYVPSWLHQEHMGSA